MAKSFTKIWPRNSWNVMISLACLYSEVVVVVAVIRQCLTWPGHTLDHTDYSGASCGQGDPEWHLLESTLFKTKCHSVFKACLAGCGGNGKPLLIHLLFCLPRIYQFG